MAEIQQNQIKGMIGDRYQIEGWIAQGGMSTVYKAIDPNLRRTVAIKLIHPHLSSDPEFVQRFEQEATAVAQLRHPNIVQVYDFDHDNSHYYMVLEYLSGETLQARLKALNAVNRRLPLAVTIQLMAAICDAVDYAHQHGMIHRDLKPANIMLNRRGEPILMDFGVARMLGETRYTATGTVIGTALYMSPEQARGERPDERADIYSLGVTLFEMITGRPPFEGDSVVAILMKHVTEPVPDICDINADTPDELVAIVEKALAKNPDDRFQTAADMAVALRALSFYDQAHTPSQASSSAPIRQMLTSSTSAAVSAPARGNRNWFTWLLGAATVMFLFLILGLAVLLVAWRFARPLILAEEVALPSAEGMVGIGGGVYLIGRDTPGDGYSMPHQIPLKEFWIDQFEVTNVQYTQFLEETGYPPPTSWPDGAMPAGQETHPVVGVSWDQAVAYCQWARKRLPTEAEWEVAARGPQNLLYPWGNDEHAVTLPAGGTYPVGNVPSNRSPFGAFDMAGNVWEWVTEPYAPVAEGHRVLRGGGHGFLKDLAYRLHGDPGVPTMIASAGFRCAADQVTGETTPVDLTALAALPAGVLFQDHFTDPSSGWPVGGDERRRFGYHPAAFYHLEVSAPNESLTMFRGLSFGDFTAETEVLVDHTNTASGNFRYGLVVRRSEDRYYAFTVSPRTGTWQALKHSPDGWEVLAEGAEASLRGLTSVDALRVDADGSHFTFSINGKSETEVDDPDYTSGDVGFIVESFDESLVHIHYASLTVKELASHQAQVLSEDDFTDPGSGWPTLDQEHSRFGYHPPDYYHVEVSQAADLVTVLKGPTFENITIETAALVDHTGGENGDFRYGLALRGSGDQYYAFTISPRSGKWQVLKRRSGEFSVLSEGTSDPIQGLTALDRLRVDADGPDLTFYLNDQAVAQLADADYTSGEVGFVVQTFDEPLVHIHYDFLTIREIR